MVSPTKGKPQRLRVDSDGTVWFTERVGGKIGHLEPESGNIKEFDLPDRRRARTPLASIPITWCGTTRSSRTFWAA